MNSDSALPVAGLRFDPRSKISAFDFCNLFRPHIRVYLNWGRLLSERWSIRIAVCSDVVFLGGLLTPWYVSSVANQCANYDDTDAKHLRVCDYDRLKLLFDQERRSKIETLAELMVARNEVAEVMLPVYEIGDRYLLLDGNHRSIALFLTNKPFTAALFVVRGPFEQDALADLKAFTHSGKQRRV